MTQPLTRDLRETIRSLEITEAELWFQSDRLARMAEPTTEQEREHLADLQRGYSESAKYVRILLNYHEGRTRGRGPRPTSAEQDEAIDDQGRATAYLTD